MKIAIIAAIKNEEDIVESFVRHNLNFADELHLIDHSSGDNSAEIVQRMIAEGLPVTIASSAHAIQEHAHVISRTARELFANADFVVPLDADEFIFSGSRAAFEAELGKIGPGQAGLMAWKTYLLGSAKGPDYLREAGLRRTNEYVSYGKVAIRGSVLKERGGFSLGNHLAFDASGRPLPTVALATTLAHLPVRSSVQMVSKSILGAHAFAMSLGRAGQTTSHWFAIAEQVRANGYVFTPQQLDELAMNYCNDTVRPENGVTKDPVPLFPNTELRYQELICSSLLERFDRFIGQAVEKIGAAKSMASMIGAI